MIEQGTPGQREAVDTNWDALTNAYEGKILSTEEKKSDEVKEEVKTDESSNNEEKQIENNQSSTENVEDLKVEAKELGLSETATKEEIEAAKLAKQEGDDKPIIEFKIDDIKGVESIDPSPDSWFAPAKALGIEIKDDSLESFKEAIEAPLKRQLEEAKTLSMDNMLTSLNPEVATAFKLLEMGIPQEQLFNPTQQIDSYLRMDNAALVRADYEAMGWKPEMVDAEMELLKEKNLLDHQAEKIRFALNNEKQNIITQRDTILQQFESKKQEAILHQKEQERGQFEKAMNTVSKFMDSPIPADVKDAIIKKYNAGSYDADLNSPQSKVEWILHKELGQKVLNTLKNTAFEKGRNTIMKKLSNVPPVSGNNAGQAQTKPKDQDNWAAAEKAFGG